MSDKSLLALCHALKKIIWQLKPQSNALSFLLLIGKINQGKSTLLRQSSLQHCTVDAERAANIYFNQHGIILELGESWLNQSNHLLQYTLKQINRCHRTLKITGIILCVDIHDILISEPKSFAEQNKAHAQLLQHFGLELGYRVDVAIIFTKLDILAGFSEFYQNEHINDLSKPLGFSLHHAIEPNQLLSTYKKQFDQLIEMLGQQVIRKMHPARSSLKRTLIREFPLQLASLRSAIQVLIQHLSPQLFHIQALYFTSAKQGGVSLDRLNKKIQHEYALTIRDTFPQSINYRAYFIEGALSALQKQTKRPIPHLTLSHKWAVGALTGIVGLSLIWLGYHHVKSSRLLDEVSKELLLYDSMVGDKNNAEPALYHLFKASASVEKMSSHVTFPTIQLLKTRLSTNTKHHLHSQFLPSTLADLEQTMTNSRQSQSARYEALKIYLMLGDAQKFSETDVLAWFRQRWQNHSSELLQKKLLLLKQIIRQPFQPIDINRQIVSDVRNYLNALPPSYLYYSLAKGHFPQEKQIIAIDGFELAHRALPVYYTKSGFQQVINKIPEISSQLITDNWVLARQDLDNLQTILQEAYCYDYVAWWRNLMQRSHPLHFQDYQQAHQLTNTLNQSNAIHQLIELIQQQTTPEFGNNSTLFNQEIASQFTSLNLLSQSAMHDLTSNLKELQKFLTTLSAVNNHSQTAFTLVKSRFMGDTLSNPLSSLYGRVQQLPDPLSYWVKQIADDAWFILINDSRAYINQQWQQTVFRDYQTGIAQRYPFDASQSQEVTVVDFERFFSKHGILNRFIDYYLKPFLDTSRPQWQAKELNNYVLPISSSTINELIRANVITTMFFPDHSERSKIVFSLQKLSLDPIVSNLKLTIGDTKLYDDQNTDSFERFSWPQSDAKLTLNSIEGNYYELDESGPWAFFKILQKVNILVDEQDSSTLYILFEINGNSGRYVLKTKNQINPFIPGILNGFVLNETIV